MRSRGMRTLPPKLGLSDLPTWRKNHPAKSADLMKTETGTVPAYAALIGCERIERATDNLA